MDRPEGGCLILFLIDSELYQNLWLVFEEHGIFGVDVLGHRSNGDSGSWNYILTFIYF